MRTLSAAAATLAVIFTAGAAFAGAATASPAAPPPAAAAKTGAAGTAGPQAGHAAEMKSILAKLVRQDDYLDEAIDTLDSSDKKLSAHDLTALSLSFKIIKKDLDAVSAMNKKEFSEIGQDPGTNACARTILSYSRSVSRKIGKVASIVAENSDMNKKHAMRDAVSSRKGKKSGKGKNLARLLEEQKALKALSSDIQNLKTSSKQVVATSRWLYIVSK
ncbi:MAG: hypothetical protein WCW52_00245 [Elusimicrobiales bacterium]|jgi:hypothetical protein